MGTQIETHFTQFYTAWMCSIKRTLDKTSKPVSQWWARNYNMHKYQMSAKGKTDDKLLVCSFILL